MKYFRIINDELIKIFEFAKPNACFQTNEYSDSYDFCILKETINPFDLYHENEKNKQELDQYKNNWEELKKWLEQEYLEWKDCEDVMTKNFATEDKNILNKMKELEEKKQ